MHPPSGGEEGNKIREGTRGNSDILWGSLSYSISRLHPLVEDPWRLFMLIVNRHAAENETHLFPGQQGNSERSGDHASPAPG